jgi:hypothetical protein
MWSRAISDSFRIFGTGWTAIGLAILGAVVTAVIVWLCRGKEELKKHVVENILIVFGGSVATWVLVFIVVLIHLPTKMLAESNDNLTKVIQEKRQFSETINALNSEVAGQKEVIERLNKSENKRPIIAAAIDKNGLPDRFLNAEQKDHLYQDLRRISDDPRQKDYVTVTIAAAYPHDRESSRLVSQLIGVFEDAHWIVTGQHVPNNEGVTQGQIPISIWVSASNKMALFVEGSLLNVGLRADTQPNDKLPPNFKGVLIVVGYKDSPL